MQIDVLTIFPQLFDNFLAAGVVRIAIEKGSLKVRVHNLRDFTCDKHRRVDDYPYGGGPGMIMKVEPIYNALEKLRSPDSYTILLSPQGRLYNQLLVKELLSKNHLILICGRYKGVDNRVREFLIDDEISIGDYILSGGEIGAFVIIETVARLLPGVIGDISSALTDTFEEGAFDPPHYTVPREFKGMRVPDVLVSGNHKLIAEWRKKKSEEIKERFLQRRRDEFARIFKELYKAE